MHFDYINDAPLEFECKTFVDRRRLTRHRDIYMGDAAAALAVYTDGMRINDSGSSAAAALYRRPIRSSCRGGRSAASKLRESAAEYYCHSRFFSSLCESAVIGNSEIEMLERSFGSVQNFRYQFCQKAEAEKRAGYLWVLKEKSGRLKLWFSAGSALPPTGSRDVLCLDLWEHSYAEIFGCDRAAYAAAFLSCANFRRLSSGGEC